MVFLFLNFKLYQNLNMLSTELTDLILLTLNQNSMLKNQIDILLNNIQLF